MAATQYGRASKIRFALPVRIDATEQETRARDAVAEPDGAHSGVRVSGSPEQIAESLLTYVTLGINEFMISGLDDDVSIAGFLHQLAPISQGRRIAGKALGGIAPSAFRL